MTEAESSSWPLDCNARQLGKCRAMPSASTPNVKVVEHCNGFGYQWAAESSSSLRVDPDNGCFLVPEQRGVEAKLDHDACRQHSRTGSRLKLFSHGWEKPPQPGPAEPGQHRPGGA